MIQQKPMYTPTEKETGKEKLQDILNVLPKLLIVVGILGMLISIDRFAIAVKPAMDFDDLLNEYAVPGDHVAGRVLYTYGCFAESSVIHAENGRKTGETKSGYYYAVPGAGGVMILEVPLRYHSAMEALTEQTFEYLYGGSEPQANARVNGYVKKNDSDSLQRMLEEYLVNLGYDDGTEEYIRGLLPGTGSRSGTVVDREERKTCNFFWKEYEESESRTGSPSGKYADADIRGYESDLKAGCRFYGSWTCAGFAGLLLQFFTGLSGGFGDISLCGGGPVRTVSAYRQQRLYHFL